MDHHGCCDENSHQAPSWLELSKAEAVLDSLIADTFGARHVIAKGRGPNDGADNTAAIRQLFRQVISVLHPIDARAEAALLRDLDVDWPLLHPIEREQVIARAIQAVSRIGEVAAPKVGQLFDVAGAQHIRATKEGLAGKYALVTLPELTDSDRRMLQFLTRSQTLFVRDEYNRRGAAASAIARQIVARGVAEGENKVAIGRTMQQAFKGTMAERSESYFRMAASVFIARANSYAAVSSMVEAGIEYAAISAANTEATCDGCRLLDGQVFPVAEHVRHFQEAAQLQDPEDIRFVTPFLRKGKDGDGEYLYVVDRSGARVQVARVVASGVGQTDTKGTYRDVLSARQLSALGVDTPPFHPHCMCEIVPAGLETTVEAQAAADEGVLVEVPIPEPEPPPVAPPAPTPEPEPEAPRRRGGGRRGARAPEPEPTLARPPTRSGKFWVASDVLASVPTTGSNYTLSEQYWRALQSRQPVPQLQVRVDKMGRMTVNDPSLLNTYLGLSSGRVPVKFTVDRSANSWARREETARGAKREPPRTRQRRAVFPTRDPARPATPSPKPAKAPVAATPKPSLAGSSTAVEVVNTGMVQHLRSHKIVVGDAAERTLQKIFGKGGMPTMKTLEKAWSSEASGHTVIMDQFSVLAPNRVEFGGKIMHEGRVIGDIYRSFIRHKDGTVEVHHDYYKIEEASQRGKGGGADMFRQSVRMYEALGYQKITVDAHWAGRYTWASFGYNWDLERTRVVAKELTAFMQRQGVDAKRAEMLAKQVSPRSWDVARLDVDGIKVTVNSEGQLIDCPIGKAYLLSGSNWKGTLVLDPEHPTYKRAKERLGL